MITVCKKILNATQTKSVDNHTISHQAIPSIQLMETASNKFVDVIIDSLSPQYNIAVFCGTGNNGGDGLAVARILKSKGFKITTYLVKSSEQLSPDCNTNLLQLPDALILKPTDEPPSLSQYDIIIDAILGAGLNKPVNGWLASVIHNINNSPALVYSIDIPTGMFTNKLPVNDNIIKSDLTVTFQRPKLSFFLKENAAFINQWIVVDIGLDENFIQHQNSKFFYIDESIKDEIKKRKRFSHKGTYGHALIIAGSKGKMGAAILTTKACLRSGTGLVTSHVPHSCVDIMQISTPESMCSIDPNDKYLSQLPPITQYSSIGIGPGLGTQKQSELALTSLLKTTKAPLVIDADAINIIAQNKALLNSIPPHTIFTPHPKEFERLAGSSNNSLERFALQTTFSKKHKCILVLKDAITSVSDKEGNLYFNTTGNPGMATGGSGDVLTGIITGLVAQGYNPHLASILAVYFHGKAGDKAATLKGQNALIASDIIEQLRIEK